MPSLSVRITGTPRNCWAFLSLAPLIQPPKRLERVEHYVEYILAPHARLWDEAMLAATLWMLVELLDVRTVYLHTLAGAGLLKSCQRPPRSIYERLPRRFCFERTATPPRFLAEAGHRRLRAALRCGPEWWMLGV